MQPVSSSRTLGGPRVLLASLLAVLLFVFLVGELRNPGLVEFDEFLTYDRTLSLLETGDYLATYTNSRLNLRKPPLQYYLGASLISAGLQPLVAIRLCSLLFALSCLGVMAALAHHLAPQRPWVVPTTLLLACSSELFVLHSRLALLDTGMAFFILLSVYSVLRAHENPRWWILWGAACGLGALQKVPMALFISIAVFLALQQLSGNNLRASWQQLQNRSFLSGICLAAAFGLFWPIVQSYRFGAAYRKFYLSRLLLRATTGLEANEDLGFRLSFNWLTWMKKDSSVLWALAIFTLLAFFLQKPRSNKHLALLLPSVIVFAGLTFSGGPVYPRYLLACTPILVPLVASLWTSWLRSPLWPILLSLLAIGFNGPRLAELPFRNVEDSLQSELTAQRLQHTSKSHERLGTWGLEFYVSVEAFVRDGQPLPRYKSGELPPGHTAHLLVAPRAQLDQALSVLPGASHEESIGEFVLIRVKKQAPP